MGVGGVLGMTLDLLIPKRPKASRNKWCLKTYVGCRRNAVSFC